MEDLARLVVLLFLLVVASGPVALWCSFTRFHALTVALGFAAVALGSFWLTISGSFAMQAAGGLTMALGTIALTRTYMERT